MQFNLNILMVLENAENKEKTCRYNVLSYIYDTVDIRFLAKLISPPINVLQSFYEDSKLSQSY